jgi:hypothetical protein
VLWKDECVETLLRNYVASAFPFTPFCLFRSIALSCSCICEKGSFSAILWYSETINICSCIFCHNNFWQLSQAGYASNRRSCCSRSSCWSDVQPKRGPQIDHFAGKFLTIRTVLVYVCMCSFIFVWMNCHFLYQLLVILSFLKKAKTLAKVFLFIPKFTEITCYLIWLVYYERFILVYRQFLHCLFWWLT